MALSTEGNAINGDDMHWTVECPYCKKEIEYKGYFDSAEKCVCPKCREIFYVNKVWLNDREYIK